MTIENQSNKLYGYARVSTLHQDLETQIEALLHFGIEKELIFSEKMSGRDMENRVELQKLLKILQPGDTLVVHKLDRLGRSVSQVTSLIDTLMKTGRYVVVIDANIDTRNNNGGIAGIMTTALITLLGLMAEMERTFIHERTMAGREKALNRGVKFGRKRVKEQLYALAIEDYEKGDISVSKLIKKYGGEITEATFYRRYAEKKENDKIRQNDNHM